jgi:hypothetical protein
VQQTILAAVLKTSKTLGERERYSKPITTVHEGAYEQLTQHGSTAVSVCNIAIHALVMATVVQISPRIAGAKDTVRQSLRSTTVMIATASIATVPVLMAAHLCYGELRGAATKGGPSRGVLTMRQLL